MFCTSLRRRPSCSAILVKVSTSSDLNLRESQLTTHDLQFPIPAPSNASTSDTSAITSNLHLLILAPSSLGPEVIRSRLQCFVSSGPQLAIVLQLYAPLPSSFVTAKTLATTSGAYAHAQLQTLLLSDIDIPYIPILPLSQPDDLPKLLQTHVSKLASLQTLPKLEATTTPFKLLRLCTLAPPMREETVYFISDLFTGLRHLAVTCMDYIHYAQPEIRNIGEYSSQPSIRMELLTKEMETVEGGFQRLTRLRDLVGESEFNNLVGFWTSSRGVAGDSRYRRDGDLRQS